MIGKLNLFSQKEDLHFLRDATGESATDTTAVNTDKGGVMEIILENEEKCSEKMKQDSPYNRSGTDTVHGNPCDADVISAC